jgi:nucleoid DNA-binding protein
VSLKKRPARQARVGINPATGEPITLPAQPEQAVPRIRFSRLVKDRARTVDL